MLKKAPHPPLLQRLWGSIPLLLPIGAAIIEISLLALYFFPNHQRQAIPFIFHMALAFSGYAVGLAAIHSVVNSVAPSPGLVEASQASTPLPMGREAGGEGATASTSKHPSRTLTFVLGASFLFRLTLLGIDPIFDDDLHRYIWDGRVSSHGMNPYLYAPEAPELEDLQDENYDLVSFKNIPTIYPPLMQWIFRGSQLLAPSSQLFLKFLAMSFDLALIATLLLLLKDLQTPLIWILAYSWNPLPIKEFTNSGHLDSVVLFLMFFSLWLVLRKRFLLAHFLIGLSVLAKLFSAITLPLTLIWAALHSKLKLFSAALVLFITLMAGYLPFLEAGYKLFAGLQIYLQYWVFNPGPFWVIERILKILGLSHPATTRSICGLIVMSILAWESWATVRQPARLLKSVFHCLGALVLFSPAVQPWYVCWLIPFFVFYPRLPWIVFSGLVSLSYLFYLNFTDVLWVRAAEYGIPVILMAFDIYWKKKVYRSIMTLKQGKEYLQ